MEKDSLVPLLPPPTSTQPPTPPRRSRRYLLPVLLLISLVVLRPSLLFFLLSHDKHYHYHQHHQHAASPCAQADPILPSAEAYNTSSVWEHKDDIVKWLQGAVRIKTEIQDEMGEPGEDPKWEPLGELHNYLEKAYPLVHKHFTRTKVDMFALVFEWPGSDESLKPIMLTAHMDVVPVLEETRSQWTHDPYAADYDGEYIWGRGANDDKSGLTAVLASLELLLASDPDFKPARTIILGFGSDEERGGQRGAPAIRDFLLDKYGPDSVSLLVDEGSGISTAWGRTFGLPAVAEKGKFNLNLTIATPGGHSSVPPPHTAIGLMSLAIVQLEKNPHPVELRRESPVWGYLQCASRYAPDMPKELKRVVRKNEKTGKALEKEMPKEVEKYGLGVGGGLRLTAGMGSLETALMGTTQAVDKIQGGVKVNALPEIVTTIVNHRTDIHHPTSYTQDHVVHTLLPLAKEYHLELSGLNTSYIPSAHLGPPKGHIYLSEAFEHGHGPAPISPTDVGDAGWNLFAGTVRGVWASRKEVSEDGTLVQLKDGEDIIMSPFMSTGNTDTRRYWDLTRNIYRWRYMPDSASGGAHTINEKVSADGMVEFVRFMQALILNADASRDV